MSQAKPLTIDDLWALQRIGAPSLSPDGAQAVAAVSSFSMQDNKSSSALWLFSTRGAAPRLLTTAGEKDGHPQWGPPGKRRGTCGELIAFTAKREQAGIKDEMQQLYLIAPDGGEARRATNVATGVEAFRWCPDGRRLLFVSWVWPDLKGSPAQAKRQKAWKDRKESGYATSEAMYRFWDRNLPQGRVPHLHLLELPAREDGTARVRDLFEGTPYELSRNEPEAHHFDVAPDGSRAVFAFDPAPVKRADGRFALAEVDLKTGHIGVIAQDADWDFGAPRYSPCGQRIAFLASHQGLKHTMPSQLAVWERSHAKAGKAAGKNPGRWEVLSSEWDHEVQAPLQWEDDGQGVLLLAEQQGRKHLWRFDIADRRAEVLVAGGWVGAYAKQAGTLVTVADSATHPGRLHEHPPGEPARRIEQFNDALLGERASGKVEEVWLDGASSTPGGKPDKIQLWLAYPPGFDPRQKYPVMHVIHGGPHTAFGDAWHYRWNAQVFAAQGYVVAMVNYHGSSSFGHAFLDSITHRWGELELQDVEAATDWLLARRWVDRRRIFATGGSYGGFMVAWMNGHVQPGRYAAYVCHAGCFDWVGMFADDAYTWHAKELGAWYWDDMAKVHAQSPHAHAAKMHTPTLVIHGALDYRVPDAQGLAYYNTLKARGVDARLLWFPDENHWILKPRNSKLWYGEFFGWLQKHDVALNPARKDRKAAGGKPLAANRGKPGG
jgi:dipeptidyl aminopeptidase/acylaminoacyl peptidase